ncbi:unnamed protein product [Cochlearia groenlandica]
MQSQHIEEASIESIPTANVPKFMPDSADARNLMVGSSMKHITFRLMRMWEARNYKKKRANEPRDAPCCQDGNSTRFVRYIP